MSTHKQKTELNTHIQNRSWKKAQTLLQSQPHLANIWSDSTSFFSHDKNITTTILPIHQACRNNPPPSIILTLITANPTSLQIKEKTYSRLPLHIAVRSGASLPVIQTLIEHYPGGVSEVDYLGRVPLHYALSNRASLDVVRVLVNGDDGDGREEGGGGVRMRDQNGWLPIHVACSNVSERDIVEFLVGVYPESVLVTTKMGNTPLSCAKIYNDESEIVDIVELLENYKCRIKEDQVALGNGTSSDSKMPGISFFPWWKESEREKRFQVPSDMMINRSSLIIPLLG